MARFFWICLGGAAGTGARYLVSLGAARFLGAGFPYGTLVVNVVGSFLLALLMHLGLSSELLPLTTRLALTTGVMGGFTTYSTFNYETMRYAQQGSYGLAALNFTVTAVGCFVAALAGWAGARWYLGR